MKRVLPILIVVVTVVLVAVATIQPSRTVAGEDPRKARCNRCLRMSRRMTTGALTPMLPMPATMTSRHLRAIYPDATAACAPIHPCSRPTPKSFTQNDNEALVRATLEYATAVGAFYDTRDSEGGEGRRQLEGGVASGERGQGAAAGHSGKLPALGRYHARRQTTTGARRTWKLHGCASSR